MATLSIGREFPLVIDRYRCGGRSSTAQIALIESLASAMEIVRAIVSRQLMFDPIENESSVRDAIRITSDD